TGNLTGITVTSPGSGYTSQPSVTLTGGGGTPVSPTASIAANAASGPMTFTGSGVTTIAPAAGSATSTGLNNVVVAGGTLKINAAPTPVAAYTFDNIGTQQNPNYDLSNHGSGQSMDGSVSGSVDFSLAGHNGSGNAATFGGDGSSININSGITDLSGTSRWSVAYWVKAASSGAGGAIFSKNTGGSWAAGNSVFYLTDTSATGGTSGSVPGAVRNNAQWIKGSTSVTDDSWHFVVMNDDGGTRSVYVDGAVSAISQDTFTGADAGTSVQLGTSTDTNSADGAFPLLGSLDSVKFYNQSLTGTQILELMNTDTVGSVPTPSLPVTAAVNISTSGATLDVGASATIGSLSGVSGGSVVLEAGTFSVGDSTSTAFAGAISGAGSLLKQGSGTLTLSGSNTYGGNTTVNAGTLAVTASGSLPSTTNLAASGGAVVLGNASQTVASLSGSTGGSLTLNGTALTVSNGGTFAADWNAGSSPSSITVSGGTMAFGGATASNGTVNANAAATFAGTTGSTAVTRSLAALNIGDGVTVGILHSAFPFTPTVLKPATTSFGAGSTIDISNNELVSNGTAAAALLKLQSGQIFSSEPADTTKAIGYINLSGADAGKFEVRYTLKGDANLDGSVAVGDLGALATSYGITTGMSWGNGDFNRDGKVDVGDLGALATNYGTHLATGPSAGDSAASAAAVASPMALVASGGSAAVPEPASGALLGIAALGLIGGRRRRHRSLN
ncbi:MAG TPA: LamG-like jellyroll fold domain-containing protein, partial [Tepidisphaeraceae bacterium]|nr:LamG-like jellyroll fold domain-containing protein [Tepidisphaeraceae bacterium]